MVSHGFPGQFASLLFGDRRSDAQDYNRIFGGSDFDQDWWEATKDPGKRAYERYLRLLPQLSATDTISDIRRLVALHERATVVDPHLGALLTVQVNLVLGTLLEQKAPGEEVKACLEDLLAGRAVGAYVLTEAGHGSDLPNLELTATYDPSDGGGFIIHTPTDAAVNYMPTTAPPPVPGISRFGIVFARLVIDGEGRGNYPFLVRLVDADGTVRPGITIRRLPDKTLGMDNSITRFDNVRVSKDCLLSHTGTRIDENGQLVEPIPADNQVWRAISRVRVGRLAISAMSAAVSQGALSIALQHAGQRDIASLDHDAPRLRLLEVPAHRDRLIDAMADTYVATTAVEIALAAFVAAAESGADEQAPELTDLVSLTKYLTTSTALKVTSEVRDRMGAQGVFDHNLVVVYRALRDAAATAEGDSYVIALQAAYRYLRTSVSEWTPESWDEVLCDVDTPKNWIAWLDARARFLQHRMVEAYAGAEGSRQARWDKTYKLALAAAEARTVHRAVEALAQRARQLPAEPREVISQIITLFAIGQYEVHGTDLLPDGPAPKTAKPLVELRQQLHESLAVHLPDLAGAFELPPELLRTAFSGDFVAQHAGALTGVADPAAS
ncbi:acyl-CoA dehydrogenase family protein [Nocardia sienata]|uniref:acyl-CoA dehydrogenase family protein n=1 Tax=Nocardia sienata TaxID=248552 RepID=UPI000A053838|nr:acyl-CoA dehydrogenase family protein [Nocardia sienata]